MSFQKSQSPDVTASDMSGQDVSEDADLSLKRGNLEIRRKRLQTLQEAELHEAEQCMSPEALRRLRRRISNRESARRLRKQRSEKLNVLVSQQDALQHEHEALKGKIAEQKARLQQINVENAAMCKQLGEPEPVLNLAKRSRPSCTLFPSADRSGPASGDKRAADTSDVSRADDTGRTSGSDAQMPPPTCIPVHGDVAQAAVAGDLGASAKEPKGTAPAPRDFMSSAPGSTVSSSSSSLASDTTRSQRDGLAHGLGLSFASLPAGAPRTAVPSNALSFSVLQPPQPLNTSSALAGLPTYPPAVPHLDGLRVNAGPTAAPPRS